jgi:hypothetical protein
MGVVTLGSSRDCGRFLHQSVKFATVRLKSRIPHPCRKVTSELDEFAPRELRSWLYPCCVSHYLQPKQANRWGLIGDGWS